jgi:hypothetical protein
MKSSRTEKTETKQRWKKGKRKVNKKQTKKGAKRK